MNLKCTNSGQSRRPRTTSEPQWEVRYGSLGLKGITIITGLAGGPILVQDQEPGQHSACNGDSPLLGRKDVARLIGCHPCTVSRDREKLEAEGLVGKKIGGRSYRWRRDDVLAYAASKGLTGKRAPGRPRTRW